MPSDLLRDVLRTPDAAHRARRWYVLPLSMAGHAAAAGAVLIIPLAAEVSPPEPGRMSSEYIRVVSTVVPDVPVPRGVRPAVARSAAAPIQAPTAIEPEKELPEFVGVAIDQPAIPGPSGSPDGLDTGILGQPSALVVAPPPAPPPVVHRVGGDIREPRKIVDARPVYPPIAVAARKEGVVILEAMIDERGRIVRLKVLRSEPLLDGAAISAVERWRYTPTLLNNVPVPVLMTITVHFTLR